MKSHRVRKSCARSERGLVPGSRSSMLRACCVSGVSRPNASTATPKRPSVILPPSRRARSGEMISV